MVDIGCLYFWIKWNVLVVVCYGDKCKLVVSFVKNDIVGFIID